MFPILIFTLIYCIKSREVELKLAVEETLVKIKIDQTELTTITIPSKGSIFNSNLEINFPSIITIVVTNTQEAFAGLNATLSYGNHILVGDPFFNEFISVNSGTLSDYTSTLYNGKPLLKYKQATPIIGDHTFYFHIPIIFEFEINAQLIANGIDIELGNINPGVGGRFTILNKTDLYPTDKLIIGGKTNPVIGDTFDINSTLRLEAKTKIHQLLRLEVRVEQLSFPFNRQFWFVMLIKEGHQCKYLTNMDPYCQFCLTCRSDMYKLSDDINRCVNETTKPSNYYLDKSVNPYVYRPCHSNCTRCENTNSFCSSCSSGYYLLEKGNTCLTCNDPGHQLFNGTTCVICHSSCQTCEHVDSCLTCRAGSFIVENQSNELCMEEAKIVNRDQYCQVEGTQRLNSLTNYYYKLVNGNKICVKDCSDAGYYLIASTGECVPCTNQNQFTSGQECKECSSKCKTCSLSEDNCTSCPNQSFFIEGEPNKCFTTGERDVSDFCFDSTNNIYLKLPRPYIDTSGSKNCVTSCQAEGRLELSDTKECVTNCPVNGYYQKNNACLQCDESCLSCRTESYNCLSCSNDYYFVSDFAGQCKKVDQISKDDYCFNESSKTYIKMPNYFYINDQGNKICLTACSDKTYFEIDGNYQCYPDCPDGYFENVNKCEQCYSSCATCLSKGDSTNHQCQLCKDKYYQNPFISTNCYLPCGNDEKFYVDEQYDFQCLKAGQDCPSNYPYLVVDSNQCAKNCQDRRCPFCNSNTLYTLKSICYTKCPNNYSPTSQRECTLDIMSNSTTSKGNQISNITIDIDDFKKSINDTVHHSIENSEQGKNTVINSDNYTFTFYPSGNNENLPSGTSKIHLGDCENILRTIYSIPPEEDLYIGVITFKDPNKFVSSSQYVVYNKKGEELDLSFCDKSSISETKPINPDYEGIDMDYIKELQEQGVDVFNKSDPIYTDRCTPLAKDGKDIPFNERQNLGYTNLTLCDEGCEFESVNLTTYEVTCNCEPKTEGFSSLLEENEILSHIMNLINNYNFYMFKCFKNLLKIDSLLSNYGNWIYIGCFASYSVLVMIFSLFQIKKIYSTLNVLVACPSVEKNNFMESKYLNADEKQVSQYKSTNTNILCNSNSDELVIDDMKNQIQITNIEVTPEELNLLEFEEAVDMDKRSFCRMTLDIICENQIFINTVTSKSIFNPFSIRLLMLIFTISAFFFFNGLFFTEEYVANRYTSDSSLNLWYIIENEIAKSIYASLLGLALSKVIMLVTSVNGQFLKILRDKEEKNKSKTIFSLIKSYKVKLLVLVIIIVALDLIFWYFISIFCTIFESNQITWIESSLISIFIYCLITLFFCFLGAILRFCGIKNNSK